MKRTRNWLKACLLATCLVFSFNSYSQNSGAVRGMVQTVDGAVAPSVSVSLKGTSKGSYTDYRGEFEINNVSPGSYRLVVSYIGLETKELDVQVSAGQTTELEPVVLKEDARQLREVTISGEKTNPFQEKQSNYVAKVPLDNLENPQVYTAITKDLLVQQLVFSVDDAVRNAPGLQKMWEATGRGGDGGAYYNSRGFVVQSQLRNGVAGNVTSRIDAANIERIEVIKGPSATLFGSTLTSYGGLINRVTKKPFHTFGGELTYSTGSFGFNRISADINTPLDKEKGLYFRLNTAYNYEGTWQDNGFNKSHIIAPSLRYEVNDRLTVSLDAELFGGAATAKPFIFFYYPAEDLGISRADQAGIDYNRAYSSNDLFQDSKSTNFFVQADYKLSDEWTSQTILTSSYSFSDGPSAYFYLMPNKYVTGNPDDKGADYLVRAVQATANSEMNVKEFQQNFIGDFKVGGLRNRLVVGLDLFSQNSNQLFYGLDFDIIPKNGDIPQYEKFNANKLDSAFQNGEPWIYPYRYKTNTFSAYVSDVINLTENLIASAGVRVDHFDNKGDFNMTTGEYTGEYSQTALSPRFGLVYQAVPQILSFFANYQNGFTNMTGTDFEGKTFKPEQANQIEGGVKVDAFAGRVSATLSYYDILVRDIVRPYAANPNFSIQDGTQLSKGVEFELITNPLPGLNVVAGFTYNESEYEKSDADVEGRRPTTAMSPIASNLWASYTITNGNLKGLGVGFGGNYASENKILNSDYYGVFTLPAYTVLNATIFYDRPNFRIGIKADNLTDKHYWTGYTTMNPQMPRNFVGSVSFKF